MEEFLGLMVAVAADMALDEQVKLPEEAKVERMREGRYVYVSDVWDLKEELGIPLRNTLYNAPACYPWIRGVTPMEDFDF